MSEARDIDVLLVEDDEDIRLSVAQVLEDEGFLVLGCSNGAMGLEALRAGVRPRVVMLDLMMPEMDGYTFLQRAKSDPRIEDVPVIVVTADTTAAERAIALGAMTFIQKPFKIEKLLSTLAPYKTARTPGAA